MVCQIKLVYTPPSFFLSWEKYQIKNPLEEFNLNRIECGYLRLFKSIYIIMLINSEICKNQYFCFNNFEF